MMFSSTLIRWILGALLATTFWGTLLQRVEAQTCNCTDPFVLTTFNTLQIFLSENQDQRLNATVEYFSRPAQQDIDVLCLQELWDPIQRQAVITAMEKLYPYSFFAPQFKQDCPKGCTLEQITPLRECLDRNDCFDLGNALQCIFRDCREEFDNLDLECRSCFEDRPLLDLEERLDDCVDEQLSGGCTFFFDGWSDNLLLSKTPLLNTEFRMYTNSPLAQWTVLYAQTNATAFPELVNVFCTHLSARVPVVDTTEANSDQITELINYAAQKVPSRSSPLFILGDFNTGPGIDGKLDPTRPENFLKFRDAGYQSSLLGANNINCTFCGSSNPLARETTSEDWMIDHIFVHEQEETCLVNAIRIADQNDLAVSADGDRIPLSDHYAVKGTYCPGEFNFVAQTFDPVETDDDDDDDDDR